MNFIDFMTESGTHSIDMETNTYKISTQSYNYNKSLLLREKHMLMNWKPEQEKEAEMSQ